MSPSSIIPIVYLPMRRFLTGVLFAGLLLAGCRTTNVTQTAAITFEEAPVSFTVMADSILPDPDMVALTQPYKERLQAEIEAVIGEAAGTLSKSDDPSMGNFAADAMLAIVQDLTDRPVEMALTNNGGLRIPAVPAGPITVERMFELMPFENMMTVIDLNAVMVDSLAQQLARRRGEPIAGFTFEVNADRRAENITIDGAPVDPNRVYRLVTSDYLANGGGGVPQLWSPMAREDLNYLLRDSFIEHVRQQQIIEPDLSPRILFP